MKILFISILSILSIIHIDDSNNKKINKIIEKEYKVKNFSLMKFNLPKSIAQHYREEDYFFKINTSNLLIGYAYTGRVYSCRTNNCNLPKSEDAKDESEYFDYLILYSKDLSIKKVSILNYRATYGNEICSKMWLKRFSKGNINKEFKANRDIDIISGATISSKAIINDFNKVNKTLDKLVKLKL